MSMARDRAKDALPSRRNFARLPSLLNAGNRDIFQKNREAFARLCAITLKD
jgi:hypothetical protein